MSRVFFNVVTFFSRRPHIKWSVALCKSLGDLRRSAVFAELIVVELYIGWNDVTYLWSQYDRHFVGQQRRTVGEVPRHRRADRPLWDGPTSAVAPRPLSLAQGEPVGSKWAVLLAVRRDPCRRRWKARYLSTGANTWGDSYVISSYHIYASSFSAML